MKQLLPLVFFLIPFFAFAHSTGEPGTGGITGRVTTNDGKAAAFVTVQVKSLSKVTLTNEQGSFEFKKLAAGTYTLQISLTGYQTTEQTVTVEENKTVSLSIQLSVSDSELQEVIVTAGSKFAKKATDYVARLPLSNLENPQVYSVIGKDLLKEQVITDPKDALRNAPGAAISVFPAGGFSITSRGFSTSLNARNGMETVASRSSIEIGNIERIEVIKGPSGTLFGASISSFGGLVNLVTKKPFDKFKGEVSYTVGSYGLNRFGADVNTPLNKDKTALFRLNALVNRQGSFFNYGKNNTVQVAPSISLKVNDRLTVLADLEYLSINQTRIMYNRVAANSGIDSPDDFKLPYNKTLYLDDADAKTFASKAFLEAQYRMSDNWTSTTAFSYVSERVSHSYQYYPTWLTDTTVARNILNYGPINNDYTNLQQNFVGQFHTGFLQHKLLVGANFRHYEGSFNYTTGPANKFIDTVNIRKTYTALSKAKIDQFLLQYGAMTPSNVSDQDTYSAYVSDVVNITNRLSAMLSLRVDRYEYKGVSSTDGYDQTSLAPKLGLVYQVAPEQVSVFGNYMSGFQNLAPVTQPDGQRLELKPVYAKQWEAGVKTEAFGKKLNVTASYYHILIDNATRTDANSYTVQDGKQESKGFELEVIANPLKGLNIFGGFAYNDNTIIKATDKTVEGHKAATAPKRVANFWVSYKLPVKGQAWGVGAGGNYVDDAYLTTANTYFMPSYALFNAAIFYDVPTFRFDIKLNNIANRKNWDLSGSAQPLRNFAASVTMKF